MEETVFENPEVVPKRHLRNLRWAERISDELIGNDYLNKVVFISNEDYFDMTGEDPRDWEASFFIDYTNYNMYIPEGMWDEPRPVLVSDMCHEKQHLAHDRVKRWVLEHQAHDEIGVTEYRLLSEIICKESAYLYLLEYRATPEMIRVSGSSMVNRRIAIEQARHLLEKIKDEQNLFDVLQFMVLSARPSHQEELIERLGLLFNPDVLVERYLSL